MWNCSSTHGDRFQKEKTYWAISPLWRWSEARTKSDPEENRSGSRRPRRYRLCRSFCADAGILLRERSILFEFADDNVPTRVYRVSLKRSHSYEGRNTLPVGLRVRMKAMRLSAFNFTLLEQNLICMGTFERWRTLAWTFRDEYANNYASLHLFCVFIRRYITLSFVYYLRLSSFCKIMLYVTYL